MYIKKLWFIFREGHWYKRTKFEKIVYWVFVLFCFILVAGIYTFSDYMIGKAKTQILFTIILIYFGMDWRYSHNYHNDIKKTKFLNATIYASIKGSRSIAAYGYDPQYLSVRIFNNGEHDIPFEIEDGGVWIHISKGWLWWRKNSKILLKVSNRKVKIKPNGFKEFKFYYKEIANYIKAYETNMKEKKFKPHIININKVFLHFSIRENDLPYDLYPTSCEYEHHYRSIDVYSDKKVMHFFKEVLYRF